jgi:hypothetical protein
MGGLAATEGMERVPSNSGERGDRLSAMNRLLPLPRSVDTGPMPVPAAPKVSLSRRIALGVLALVIILIGAEAWSRVRLRMSGAPQAALQQLEACEQARNLLGENIAAVWWGWSHGHLRTPRNVQAWAAASSSVDWRMPVAGDSGRGVLHFQGRKSAGFWELDSTLEVDDVTLHVSTCAGSGSPP